MRRFIPSSNKRPYRNILKYEENINVHPEKITDILNLANNMNTNEMKLESLRKKTPLTVFDPVTHENLIHKVIDNDNKKIELVRLNVIKFLVNEGVNPDSPNRENNTPLHLACKKQYCEIIKYLLEIGVRVNYINNVGMTPLHFIFSGFIKPCGKLNRELLPLGNKKILDNKIKVILTQDENQEIINQQKDMIKRMVKEFFSSNKQLLEEVIYKHQTIRYDQDILSGEIENKKELFKNYYIQMIQELEKIKDDNKKSIKNLFKDNEQLIKQARVSLINLILEYYEFYKKIFFLNLYKEYIKSIRDQSGEQSVDQSIESVNRKLNIDFFDYINTNLNQLEISLNEVFDNEKLNTNIKFLKIKLANEIEKKNKKYILYSNDYTNTETVKVEIISCIDIKKDCIDNLLKNMARLNIKDYNNFTPIYYLIKNYYWKEEVFETIFKYISEDFFKNDKNLKKYIYKEIQNHNLKNKDCDNFIKVQFESIKNSILADESLGNNILINIDTSFKFCYYYIQDLINSIFTENDILNYENLKNKNMDLYKQFIKGDLRGGNILIDVQDNQLTNIDYYDDFKNKNILKFMVEKLEKNKKNINKIINLIKGETEINQQMKIKNIEILEDLYFRTKKYTEINPILKFMETIIIGLTKDVICFGIDILTKKILLKHFDDKFKDFPKDQAQVPVQDQDQVPVQDQDQVPVQDQDQERKGNLKKFKEGVILNKGFNDYLYNVCSIKFVKNSEINMFKNKYEEYNFDAESNDEILKELFDILVFSENSILNQNDSTYKLLIEEVIKYFDNFINKTIQGWIVIMENQMKFFINAARLQLIKDKLLGET